MILDEVLDEAYSQFDSEDMTDSFVEGFLYAMELQESGSKLRNIDIIACVHKILFLAEIRPHWSSLSIQREQYINTSHSSVGFCPPIFLITPYLLNSCAKSKLDIVL